jgi:endogenous inhibitor of DNA gyrase (YacG/DUF329 family)
MTNKNSMEKNSKTLTSLKDEGVLKIKCPVCGKGFRYRRGRVKNPDLKELDNYFKKAQCPHCGQPLRFREK